MARGLRTGLRGRVVSCHVREMLRRRPPIGMPCETSELTAAAAADEGEAPFADAPGPAATGGPASITSWIFRIHVDAIDELPATYECDLTGCRTRFISIVDTSRARDAEPPPPPLRARTRTRTRTEREAGGGGRSR